MAVFGRMSHYDFTASTPQERAKYIKDWARNELGRSAGTDKFAHMMDDVRIGHESRHYDEGKRASAGNFDELTDILFSDDAQVKPYMMTDKEMSHVVGRAVREVQTVSTFIDAGRATYSIVAAIHDNACDVGNWITFGGRSSADFKVDFDGVFCGSGMLNRPTGYVMGQMFPEVSTTISRVVLQKDRGSTHFFRAHTAFPDLAEECVPTGRFLDKEIEKALKSERLPAITKGYWNLSLCGYQIEMNKDQTQMRCNFEYEGKKYTVQMQENSWQFPNPYVKVQNEQGKWEKISIHDLPETVRHEALKIHRIMSGGTKELTNIRDGILRDATDLAKETNNREDIQQE